MKKFKNTPFKFCEIIDFFIALFTTIYCYLLLFLVCTNFIENNIYFYLMISGID